MGVSRSGTKLLRDLLNNHVAINIPLNEAKFIPFLYNKILKYFIHIFNRLLFLLRLINWD